MQDLPDPPSDGSRGSSIDDLRDTPAKPRQKARPPTVDVLATLALDAALTSDLRDRLRTGAVTALLVKVPTPEWCEPVWDALRCLGLVDQAIVREETGRFRPDRAANLFAGAELAAGRRIAGISHELERLPPVLVRAADAVVTIPPPTPAVLRRVIGEVTGRRPPRRVSPSLGVGLGLTDVVAAVRAGSTPAASIERLERASTAARAPARADETPPLGELHGYGEAREWGLGLARSIAQVRANQVDPRILPRGVLLEGESGTGKTLFVRALAKACDIPLVATTVGEWFTTFREGSLDDVARACTESYRSACDAAAASSLALWFIDEVDALPNRGALEGRGRDFWVTLIAHVLALLDGARARGSIIVVGATNHGSRLDPALVRAGRFDVRMTIRRPDQDGIQGILRTHLGRDLPKADLRPLALAAVGATGADVAQWVREARRRAAAAGRSLHLDDLAAQIVVPDPRLPRDILRSALHEAGHAVAISVLMPGDRIQTVSILADGGSGGHTTCTTPAGVLADRAMCEARIMTLLAGRACEVEMMGDACAGSGGSPESDLARATSLATQMHTSLGFGSSLLYRGDADEAFNILRFDPVLRQAVETLLGDLHERTLALVRRHRSAIKALAAALVQRKVLDGEELTRIIHPLLGAQARTGPARRAATMRQEGASSSDGSSGRAPPDASGNRSPSARDDRQTPCKAAGGHRPERGDMP